MSPSPSPRTPGRRTPRRAGALVAALVALGVAAPAPAAASAPRIAVAPVKGDPSGKIRAQLRSALCAAQRCVPGANGARLARARKAGVEATVLASVLRGRHEVSVSLVSRAGRRLQAWRLPLGTGGRIPAHRLSLLAEDVRFILRPGAPPAPRDPAPDVARGPAPAPPSPPPQRASLRARPLFGAEPQDPLEPQEPDAAQELPVVEVVTVPRVRVEQPATARPWGTPARPPTSPRDDEDELPPLVAADAAVDSARHALSFPSSGKRPVGYVVNLYAVPRLRVETHALGELWEEAAAVGLFAEGAYVPGLEVPADARTMRVSYLRLRAGAHWRWPLDGGLVLRPALAWEVERLSVRVAGGGRFPSLPDTALSGPSLGLDLDLPLGRTRFGLLGAGRAIWWLRAGELAGGAGFFPGGRALGLELEAGGWYRLSDTFSLGLVLSHASTFWWLEPAPGGAFAVTSARASTWGGRAWVRLER